MNKYRKPTGGSYGAMIGYHQSGKAIKLYSEYSGIR